jgi:hypothetical protein
MARNKPTSAEIFGKSLNARVVQGKTNIKIALGVGNALRGDPALVQVAPVFWYTSATSLTYVAQLIAFKLFDPRNGSLTIEALLGEAEKLKKSFPNATCSQVEAVITIARTQIGNLKVPLKQIREKRNRALAHFDPSVISDPKGFVEKIKVTWSDLNLVLGTAGTVLNDLSVAFRDISPLFDPVGSGDYDNALNLIADAQCSQIRQYEVDFGHWDGLRPKKCP